MGARDATDVLARHTGPRSVGRDPQRDASRRDRPAGLQTLIVGMGRSGRGLHLPVLARVRVAGSHRDVFADGPVVAFDLSPPARCPQGTVLVGSLEQAVALAPPAGTVVHVCTPPAARVDVLERVARLGYRRVLVEKPLAVSEQDLRRIDRLRERWDLELAVVAPWLSSLLTDRMATIVREHRLGPLRSIFVLQRKPRFTRSLTGVRHPTAFDVEVPHALGVVLRLAGSCTVRDASCADMVIDDVVVPRMGRAWLQLEHAAGVRTEILCDFTAPVRQRRVAVAFEGGVVVGHYPCSEDDDTAQLEVNVGGAAARSAFRDDALETFMLRTYRAFATGTGVGTDLPLHAEVVRLLSRAKRLSGPPVSGPGREAQR